MIQVKKLKKIFHIKILINKFKIFIKIFNKYQKNNLKNNKLYKKMLIN